MANGKRLLSLDTETTGLSHEEGDRVIEIGIVEYDGLTPTGRTFHQYLDPEGRQIAAGATQVHGITNDQVAGKPVFADIVGEMLDFIGDDETIIYNAGFDVGFLNAELERLGRDGIATSVTDVMPMVQRRFPRSRFTLEAAAKKLGVDTSRRTLHGALIDAEILGDVYRMLVQQTELIIAEVSQAVISPTTHRAEAKPIRKVETTDITTLPHVETTYTLFASALQPDALPGLAAKCGYKAVALADRNTTAGAMAFAEAAKKAGVKGIVGASIPISSSDGRPITLYARNEAGWRNIQKLVTIANVEQTGKGLTSKMLRDHADGVAVTGGGSEGAIAHILRTKGAETAVKTATLLAEVYPGAFALEITRHGGTPDAVVEAGLTSIADQLGIPVIGTVITRAAPGDADLVEVMRAIGGGHSYQSDTNDQEQMRTPAEMEALFEDLPNAVGNADWIADLCDFLPTKADPMLPRFDAGGMTEDEAIVRMATDGLNKHLESVSPGRHAEYRDRFAYEMGLITKLGFSGYFLIVADFIGWAKDQGIPIGPGRGSGAGSIVAWSLGITALDPIEFKLLFERFINPDRVSLPDFDVDMCEERRGEVIRYVRQRYGSDKVVAIGAYGTIQHKNAIKDVGRVLGLPYGQTDKISKLIPKEGLTDEIIASEEMQALLTTPASREAFAIARRINGLVRSKGRHPAGVIIADRPVAEITALELDANDTEQAVTQYDMKPVEKAGLVKFDFLGLQALTTIERARTNLLGLGIDIDPYKVALDDQGTFEDLTKGNTMGVFQLESDGITRAVREVRIDNFEDIIALISLYRPGPMEFIPLYARRKKGLEPFGTPHLLLDGITRDTFGILVYQEQVMQAAQVLAGYTLGQADLLRRAMGKKIQAEMDAQRANFVKGCFDTNRINEERANALFAIIDKFAGYGFNRSHAAAYALIAYVTAWLRTHHPAAFLAAALDGAVTDGKTEKIVALAQEAKRHGITLLPPAMTADAARFKPVDDRSIRWSLTGISGIGAAAVQEITARAAERPFESVRDFVARTGDVVNRSHATSLAAAGVFDEIAGSRIDAIRAMREGFDGFNSEAKARRSGQQNLFGDELAIEVGSEEIDEREILALERTALGLSLSAHPLDTHEATLRSRGIMLPSAAMVIMEYAPVTLAMHVDEVKTGKNRNAWMTVKGSDENVTLTLGCQDDLPGAHLLKSGEILIVRASMSTTGGERRIRIDEVVGPIEERPGRIVEVGVNEKLQRNDLRRIIGQAQPGPDRLAIRKDDDMEMTPCVVSADDDLLIAIRGLDGVEYATL